MRITDSLRAMSLQQNVETGLDNLNAIQEQIATGRKLNLPSDDPAGASQSIALRGSLVDNAQFQRDANDATAFLSATDSALGNAGNLLQSARQIAVQGATSTQTPESMIALSQQVDGLIHQLTQVANSDVHGKYLFSGTNTHTTPYIDPDPSHAYQGNTGRVTATIGTANSIVVNTPGSAVFGGTFSALETLKSDLAAGNSSAVSGDITALDGRINVNSTARATAGARMNEVTATSERLTRAESEYQDSIAKIEDTDLAQAYVQLQSAQNVYQASLVTTSKAFQYSLANYL